MHSHILYGVDDGPRTIEQSVGLLKQAATEGITHIFSTSHATHPMFHANSKVVIEQVSSLQQHIHDLGLALTIHAGHEIRATDKIVEHLLTGHVLSLADSRYILLELPSDTVPLYTKKMVVQLIAAGFVPIIAHPERNKGIAEKPSKLEELVHEGAVAQITAGSLSGHFGKSTQKLALDLVKANLVHVYGSDVHNDTTRPFLYKAGLAYLEKQKQLDTIDMLLENNARIIENKEFIFCEPQRMSSKKWWNILAR